MVLDGQRSQVQYNKCLGLVAAVRGGRNQPCVGGDSQSWSNFVGERSGPVYVGRIRSSKSERLLVRSDSV